MNRSVLVLVGIALGCAASAVGLVPSKSVGQTAGVPPAIAQYCTDTCGAQILRRELDLLRFRRR
jgi:hypothetical protein